jgi:hypothetical protein
MGRKKAIGVNGLGSSLHRGTLLILPGKPAIFNGEEVTHTMFGVHSIVVTGHSFNTMSGDGAIALL